MRDRPMSGCCCWEVCSAPPSPDRRACGNAVPARRAEQASGASVAKSRRPHGIRALRARYFVLLVVLGCVVAVWSASGGPRAPGEGAWVPAGPGFVGPAVFSWVAWSGCREPVCPVCRRPGRAEQIIGRAASSGLRAEQIIGRAASFGLWSAWSSLRAVLAWGGGCVVGGGPADDLHPEGGRRHTGQPGGSGLRGAHEERSRLVTAREPGSPLCRCALCRCALCRCGAARLAAARGLVSATRESGSPCVVSADEKIGGEFDRDSEAHPARRLPAISLACSEAYSAPPSSDRAACGNAVPVRCAE
ncbi:hypothetical protein J2S43_008364 [Catenuloplanes nepalensis]|uniref:Uncharacterized protein n=1 Tax=Catenuloplanes nepalensis TaxID=587533 RepID=A0ABT9N812_9ACTN|nr:hypothetical protein [Catenuloplanes nepalensis]